MQNKVDRAKQFLPFDALKGFQEELRRVEEEVEEKEVDYFSKVEIGDIVFVKYYYHTEYMEMVGIIRQIDLDKQLLLLLSTAISFSDIIDIKKYEK